jgi:hypothetical protein
MIGFLLATQLPGGGWPYVNKPPISTLSTGHTLSSLILAKRYISDSTLVNKIDAAISKGIKWLEDNQNPNGGWGVQPDLGSDGKFTRISSTYYALRPYWMQGITHKDSNIVSNGAKLLLKYQHADGGWPYIRGQETDNASEVSNTARAILGLVRSGYLPPDSDTIQKGLNYLISNKISGSSWRLGVEGFSSASPATTLYHNNSPCDALEALIECNVFSESTKEAFVWLLTSQRDDGIWELTSPDISQHGLERAWTWSTSEFIHVLNLASQKYFGNEIQKMIAEVKDNK